MGGPFRCPRSDNRNCRRKPRAPPDHSDIGPDSRHSPSTTRRRVRLGAFAVALFVTTSAVWLVFVTPGVEACRRHFGHDFLPFYVAGSLTREGRHADLYDLDVLRARERAVAAEADLALGDAVGPWWNPPPYAWVFAPLSRLPFSTALLIWSILNVAAIAAALRTLSHLWPGAGGLVPVLVLSSAPFLQSLPHGQNSPTSLLILAAVAVAWRRDFDFAAGALVGLLLYKPQLAAAVAVVLVLHRGWRAAAGLALVASVLLVITLLTMPGALTDYVHRLPHNLHVIQVQSPYLWERHVTLKAFWRLLLQGRGPGETSALVDALTFLTALPLAAGLAAAAWRARRADGPPDALVAAAVATAPLLMPFYFDYDLLLLAVPAVVIGSQWDSGRYSRWLLPAGGVLYLWLFVNPHMAGFTRMNLAVPLLATVTTLLLAAAIRGTGCQPVIDDRSHGLATRAADEALDAVAARAV